MTNSVSRLYIRDARTRRWHEVYRSGASNVTTFCRREYRDQNYSGQASPYDARATWPNPKVLRCKTCIKKALRQRA